MNSGGDSVAGGMIPRRGFLGGTPFRLVLARRHFQPDETLAEDWVVPPDSLRNAGKGIGADQEEGSLSS